MDNNENFSMTQNGWYRGAVAQADPGRAQRLTIIIAGWAAMITAVIIAIVH